MSHRPVFCRMLHVLQCRMLFNDSCRFWCDGNALFFCHGFTYIGAEVLLSERVQGNRATDCSSLSTDSF
jgi:hypothetical protein